MGMEVTSLSVQVKSDGIDQATKSLDALGSQAERTEKSVGKLTEKLANTSATFAAIKASLNEMKAVMALSFPTDGANALNKAMMELSSTLATIKGKNIKVDVGAKDLGSDAAVARKGVESLNQSLASGQNVMQMFGKELYHIRNLLGGTMLAGALVEAAKATIQFTDAWTLMNAKLKMALGTAEKANSVQQQLYASAQELRVPLEDMAKLFTRLVPAMTEYGYSMQDALSVTRSMSAALAISGATAAETSSVLLQFSQAMQSGRLNGAEFNAMAEAAPVVLRAIQKELLVNRKELKDMGADGEISVTIITDVMKKMEAQWVEQNKNMPITFDKAITQLENSMKRFLGTSTGAKDGVSAIANSISFLAKNLDTIGNTLISVTASVATFYAALAIYNTIAAVAIARSTVLAAEVGLVGVAAEGSALGIGILKTAMDFLAKHPIIIALSVLVGLYTLVASSAEKAKDPIVEANDAINETLKLGSAAPAALTKLINEQQLTIDKANKAIDEWKAKKKDSSNYQDIILYNERIVEQQNVVTTATAKQKEFAKALEETNNRLTTKFIDENIQNLRAEIALKQLQIDKNEKFSASRVKQYEAEKQLAKLENGITDAKKKNANADVSILQANVDKQKNVVEELKTLVKVDEIYDKIGKKEKQHLSLAESFDKKYNKEIEKISLFIAKQDEELNARTKLTEAQLMSVKIGEFIENNSKNLAVSEKTRLGLAQDAILTKGVEIELRKAEVKTLELLQDRYYKEQDSLLASQEAVRLTNQEMQRKMELLEMTKAGVQESAVGEQLYAIRQNEAALASVNEAKSIREKALALADVRAKMAQTPEEQALAQKEISMLKEKLLALNTQSSALSSLIPQQKKQLKALTELSKITMLDIGRTPGQILADGFGEAGAAIAKMSDAYKTFGDDMAKVDKYVADQKKMLMDQGPQRPEDLAKVDKEVADKRIQINAQMYGSLAGAAKGFFSENSKGYQAMAKAEKAFRVIELAMAAKTALTKMALMGETLATYLFGVSAATAATEASVAPVAAAEAAKAQAAGATAVTNAAQMPGPMAFVGAAAMIALLAGIGVMLGGSSSTPNLSAQRQATQGTGSVFGDSSAKSESTTKALELVAKNSEISLKYNEGMLSALKNIESSLVGVAKLVIRGGVQSQVGFAAGMGTTTDSSMNKAFGIGNQLGSMNMATLGIGSLINSVGKALFSVKKSVVDSGFLQAAQSLTEIMSSGLAVKGYTDIETKKKKFGKTKTSTETNLSDVSTELQDQLTKVVINIGDSISNAAKALSMDGSSFSDALNSFVVDIGRISIQGMDAKQIQETLTNVFSKLGDDMATAVLPGLTKFQNIGEGYFETLTRVATTVATVDGIFGQFGQTFSLTGMEAIDAKMKLVDLAGGLQELASKVTSFYDHFSTEAEKQANQTKIVTDQFAKLGLTMIDLKADDARIKFRELVESLKDTNLEAYNSMLNLEGIVNDLTPAFAKVATAAEIAAEIAEQKLSMQDKINQLTMTSSEYLAASRKKELEKMDKSLRPLQQRINALEDEKQALALQDKINQLTMSKQDYLILTRQKELAAMDESLRPLQQRIYAIEDEKTALETLKTSANKAMSVLEKSVTAEKTALKKSLDDKLANIDYAKEYENAVYEVAKANIESKASADEAYYSNQQKALETQVTASKEYYDNIKSLFDNISSTIDKLTSSSATLQSQTYKTAKAQLDSSAALAKVGILPNTEAFKSVTEGLTSLSSSGFSSLLDFQREQLVNAGKLQSIKDVAGPQMSNAEAAVKYAEQSVASIKILSDDASQFYKDQLKELDDNHKGNIQRLDDQIKILNLQYQDDIEYLDSILSVAKSQLELAEGTYIETKGVKDAVNNFSGALISYISAKDAQTADWVNRIGNLALSTVPTLTDIAERASTENQQLKDEIAGMREDAAAQSRAIAANTAATAKVLKQWDGDGQPEVRNVA